MAEPADSSQAETQLALPAVRRVDEETEVPWV